MDDIIREGAPGRAHRNFQWTVVPTQVVSPVCSDRDIGAVRLYAVQAVH